MGTAHTKERTLQYSTTDGMTVDPLWDSIVTSGNLPVRKLRGSLPGRNQRYEERDE